MYIRYTAGSCDDGVGQPSWRGRRRGRRRERGRRGWPQAPPPLHQPVHEELQTVQQVLSRFVGLLFLCIFTLEEKADVNYKSFSIYL